MRNTCKNGLSRPEKDDSETIDEAALGHTKTDDETSLSEALSKSSFKRTLIRAVIKLKNHISIIPLLMAIVSMIVITFTIPYHVNAMVELRNDGMNAFYFFWNVVLSLMVVLCYLRVYNRKSSRKLVIIMSVLFYIVIAVEIVIDIYYLHDIAVETSLYNALNVVTDDSTYHYIVNSQAYTFAHIICLGVTVIFSILAPILQPFTKKIHIRVR